MNKLKLNKLYVLEHAFEKEFPYVHKILPYGAIQYTHGKIEVGHPFLLLGFLPKVSYCNGEAPAKILYKNNVYAVFIDGGFRYENFKIRKIEDEEDS